MQIVADEDQPHAALAHQLVEDGQHLHLHGDVERRGRLVGDQEVGVGDQHHGDHHPLAHAAGDLVRIERVDPLGVADLHGLQHRERRAPGVALAAAQMAAVRLGDLLADATSPG